VSTLLQRIKKAQPDWFSPGNKRFFGDCRYTARRSPQGQVYLIRYTAGWTDMFDGVKKYHYRLSKVNGLTLEIEPLIDEVFMSFAAVKAWLEEH